jgi:hypothetical protein
MTTTAQLKREIELISHALEDSKPKPQELIFYPYDAFTAEQWLTICNAEEIITTHELNDNHRTNDYSETEKQTVLTAYHLITNYHATHTPKLKEQDWSMH